MNRPKKNKSLHDALGLAAGLAAGLVAVLLSAVARAAPEQTFAVTKATAGVASNVWGFYIIGGLTVAGAVATITRRNPVVASVCLVGTLVSTAGLYLLLNATFMAVIQMLVYAGAIMVLFVLVVMAVDRPDEQEIGLGKALGTKVIGVIAVVMLFARLTPVMMGPEVPKAKAAVEAGYGTVQHVGRLLFSNYLFPFEAISILLLVAIVGAVVVTRRKPDAPDAK